jgi:hypothetical protein
MYRIFPEIESVVVWLGRNRNGAPKILMAMDGTVSVISDAATEYKIQSMTVLSDAIGYLFGIDGHIFYLITFPTENKTFVYDCDMKVWHEQQMINGDKYFASCYANFQDKQYLGHLNSAKISELSNQYLGNDDEAIHCIRVSNIFSLPSYERININRFELNMRKGVGYKTTESIGGPRYSNFNSDPEVYLSHSQDGGYHFSQQRWAKIGEVGEANQQVVWTGFPISQRHVFRIDSFNKVKIIILGAFVQLENMGY